MKTSHTSDELKKILKGGGGGVHGYLWVEDKTVVVAYV